MSSFSDTLEDAFRRAFTVQDSEALKRTVRILEEGYDPVRRLESDVTGLKSDVRIIAERMEQGFLRMDERFKAVDERFKTQERFLALGMTLIVLLMTIYEFVG